MAVCTTGAEWASESAYVPGPHVQIVQAILRRTLASTVIKSAASSLVDALVSSAWPKCLQPVPPIASAFVFRSTSSENRSDGDSESCPRAKIFTQLSRVRHLVVTVCCFDLKHDSKAHLQIQAMKKRITISLLISAVLCTSAYATPKVVIISLDGATPRIVDQLNASGQLNPNEGINLLRAKGFSAQQNITIAPSLTAAAHIAIATGSIAAANDVVSNTFHLVASPFTFNISGFPRRSAAI